MTTNMWSWRRWADAWSQPASPPAVARPRARRVQHIETIGGGTSYPTVLGMARLPTELVVHIVLIAADDASARARLELARVSRACHRAILSTFLLPDICLYGADQLRAFTIALDKNRLGIRDLARTRVQSLAVRADKVDGLFDASQAQVRFERYMMPFLRLVMNHLQAVRRLVVQGVPKRLEVAGLHEMTCIMGHWGGDVQRGFWDSPRWAHLEHVQLHGPHLRLTPQTAATLAALPHLKRLGLVVPAIVPATTNAPGEEVELDVGGRINPLQVLLDRCASLEVLLLVAHAEKDYVGYAERYRAWLRTLRKPAAAQPSIHMVTVFRSAQQAAAARMHPCEVSAWMMRRAQYGQHWFDGQDPAPDEALEYVLESFELASPTGSLNTSTAGGSTPFGARTPGLRIHPRQTDVIDPAELLADDSDDD